MDTREILAAFSITAEDIAQAHSPSPEFRAWAQESLYQGDLETIIAGILKAGVARTKEEALRYLKGQFELHAASGAPKVLIRDVKHVNERRAIQRLEELLGTPRGRRRADFTRICGTIGHAVIPRLLAGEYAARNGYLSGISPLIEQPGLFDCYAEHTANGQGELFEERLPPLVIPGEENGPRLVHAGNFANRVKRSWHELIPHVWPHGRRGEWREYTGTILKLEHALASLFGEELRLLRAYASSDTWKLYVITLLTWASAVASYRRDGARILFREIPVLDQTEALSGGRVDALEVTAIGGKKPSRREREILFRIARERFSSVAHLVRRLKTFFAAKVSLKVVDWKFAVGDAPSGETIVPEEVRNAPYPAHVDQVRWYAALSRTALAHEPGLTAAAHSIEGAEVVYFVPDMIPGDPKSFPVSHSVRITPGEEEKVLAELASEWDSVRFRATLRRANEEVIKHVIALCTGAEASAPQEKGGLRNRQLPALPFEELHNGSAISAKIGYLKDRIPEEVYADPDGLILVKGQTKGGRPRYLLDVRRLEEALAKGTVLAGHFTERGGVIACPIRKERTPSFNISFEKGVFFCFGCHASGTLIERDREHPHVLTTLVSPARALRARRSMEEEVCIPEEHHEFMRRCAKGLQEYFKESEGEAYLMDERRLDPDRAAQLGAGYGDPYVIHDLLDSGHELDTLIHYGIVAISPRVSTNGGIVPLLKYRGMGLHEIRRPLPARRGKEGRGSTEWGMPYFTLSGYLTFPMKLRGKYTNLYGRAAFETEKLWRHKKLSNAKTRVNAGAFNSEALEGDTHEVLVTEAVLDALTLMEMGALHVLAVIGTGNKAVIEEVIRSGKRIALAMDADAGGREATERLLAEFNERGLSAGVYDFTSPRIFAFTEASQTTGKEVKDWNGWWTAVGKDIFSRHEFLRDEEE